jgi:Lon protease-like protein
MTDTARSASFGLKAPNPWPANSFRTSAFEPAEKQAFLHAPDLKARFETLTTLLEIDASEPDDERPHLQ